MITLIVIPVAIVSFVVGKYAERIQWNKLIKMGKLPKPTNPNLNHEDYWSNRYKN